MALRRLLELEPGNLQARFWLALAKEQDGKADEAAADYDKLLVDTPPDAPWRQMLLERREAVRKLASGAPATASSASPGPSEAEVAAASRMSPDERRTMIEGMVSGLAARLEKNGRDVEGWQRLIRALAVLGRKDEATAALSRARKSLADEPQALATLADLARSLGLGT
ncbi:MAG: hypothetical protein JSS20_21840 [Proteobacteria bacterium]|nr:hypothetical protein [Pseudomonadota bacterium]